MQIFWADTADPAWEKHLSALPQTWQTAILRLQQSQDRRNSIAGKWLLQTALCNLFQFDLYALTYALSPQGKPFLAEYPHIHFNLSHAHQKVVAAFQIDHPVGIDLEWVRPIDLTDFRDTFSTDNWQALQADTDPLGLFFKYWTMKEAVLKYVGQGLVEPLSDLHIEANQVWWQGKAYTLQSQLSNDGYWCSWVMPPGTVTEIVHQIISLPSVPLV